MYLKVLSKEKSINLFFNYILEKDQKFFEGIDY